MKCAIPDCPNPVTSRHPKARFCSNACKSRSWRDRTGYVIQAATSKRVRHRRTTRDGLGVRLYLSETEAAALARGEVPATVAAKAKAKLRPPAPIAGQTTIYDHLEDPCQDEEQAATPAS